MKISGDWRNSSMWHWLKSVCPRRSIILPEQIPQKRGLKGYRLKRSHELLSGSRLTLSRQQHVINLVAVDEIRRLMGDKASSKVQR
jgi:hypothetical protein